MRGVTAIFWAVCAALPAGAQNTIETDSFDLPGGTLKITFLGHATLMLEYGGKVIHVDPVSAEADYGKLPKADLVLVTHDHGDHLDAAAIHAVSKPDTQIILNETSQQKLKMGVAMKNGESREVAGLRVEAIAAYNTTAGRDRFHPKGRDNGYLLTVAGKRIYIAGDTEDTPEMRALGEIWIAFLPVNQPYTMTPAQAAAAARAFRPAILYPYHYGQTDLRELQELLKTESGIELRIRRLA